MSYQPFSDMSHSPFSPLAFPLEKPAVDTPSAANNYSKEVRKSTPTPWYRTIKGLAITIAGSFVVVGVIVAVAVGVTQSKNNRSEDSVSGRGQVGVTTDAPTAATAAATTTTAIMTTTATTTAAAATTTTAVIITTATTTTVAANNPFSSCAVQHFLCGSGIVRPLY